jgi:hypothetical protein
MPRSMVNTATRKYFLITVTAPEEFTAEVIREALTRVTDNPGHYPLDVSEWDITVEDLRRNRRKKEEKP